MVIRAAFQYSHRSGYQSFLEAQLTRAGIPFIADQDKQFSWRRRLLWTRDIAAYYPNDLLIFLDAWDTVLLGTREQIEGLRLDGYITLAGAKTCWPDAAREPEYTAKDPWTTSPWRFINSNPMAGLGSHIAEAISWGWERFPLQKDSRVVQDYDVCERFWTNLYFQSPFDIRIDSRCRLGQIFLYSEPGELEVVDGRLYNHVTRTWPVFLHANGHTTIPEELLWADK